MATRRLGNAQQEIEDARSRLVLKSWDTMSFDVSTHMRKLRDFIAEPPGDNELNRHVVVASIAALQTFHRGTIISIIDTSDEYKQRAAENIAEKFSLKDALRWLSGRTFTFGEIVAHTVPCNSTTDMLSWLSALLALDMRGAMAESIRPERRRNQVTNPPRVVQDVDAMLGSVAEAFRLRHIFAHEAASNVEIDSHYCKRLYEAVQEWIDAVDAVLWATVYRDFPLTTLEMNEHARAEVAHARRGLATAMRKARTDARKGGSAEWLRRNHKLWTATVQGWSADTYGSLQGTMWPSVRGADFAEAIRARTKQINDWTHSQHPD